jgi:hypothetical protein
VQFLDVAWTGYRFVAVGSPLDGDGVVLDSPDGLMWHRQSSTGPGDRPVRVAAGSRGVVAIGVVDDRPASWASADGLVWVANPDAFPIVDLGTDTIDVTDVVAIADGWLAVGRRDPECNTNCGLDATRALAWTSTDGLDWRAAPDQPSLEGGGMNAVVQGPSGLVAVGVTSARGANGTARAAAWTSADGVTWTRAPANPAFDPPAGSPGSAPTVAEGVAANDGVVVAVGTAFNAGPGGAPAAVAWFSIDGTTWVAATVEASTPSDLRVVTGTTDGFLAVGMSWPGCPGIRTSRDGHSWRCAVSAPVLDGFMPYAAAANASVEVLVGLTSVGHDEGSGLGLPGAAFFRMVPSA